MKVQYPGIAAAIEADLGNVGLVFGGLGQLFPGLEPGPLVAELRARLREELDYEREAEHQQRFADYYEGHPFIHIPAVLPEYSSRCVLTTELAEGVRFAEATTWPQEEQDLAAETIFRFVFGSLYRLGLFNGDPHPGNYLFRPGGRVTFLDFGLVTPFGGDELVSLRALIETMVLEPDPVAFRRAVEGAGFLKPGAPVSDAEVVDYFGHFYEYLQEDHRSTIGHDLASENVRRVFDATGPYREVMRLRQRPAAVRHRAAHQSRALRDPRVARCHGELAPPRRGDVALGRWPAVDAVGRARAPVASRWRSHVDGGAVTGTARWSHEVEMPGL